MSEAAEIRGLEELTGALGAFPDVAAGRLETAMGLALTVAAGEAAEYPAAPSGSDYRRTVTLGRLWLAAKPQVDLGRAGTSAFVTGTIGNATPYGPWVMGNKTQAWMHQGRWRTTDQVVSDAMPMIGPILDEAGAGIVGDLAERSR